MRINETLSNNAKAIAVVIPAIIILFPLGYSVVCSVFSQGAESSRPFLEMPDEQYTNCVKDTTYMRFHHMHLLKEMRDGAVRGGIRDEIEFKSCRECHPSRERFCNRCHDAVNLHPNCFGCHYYP